MAQGFLFEKTHRMNTTTTAFFDLDYTLLNTSSSLTYLKEALKQRRISPWLAGAVGLLYKLKALDFGRAHARLITQIGRHGQTEAAHFFAEWIPRALLPCFSPAGVAKIAWHQNQGHHVVIVSASIEEIVKPAAQHLGLGENYLCTHLAVENGHYTGSLSGPVCYGAGKVHWAKQWAAHHGLPFPQTVGYMYSDSSSDLPLMDLAQHPVAVNPSLKLAKIAAARGWPVEKFY